MANSWARPRMRTESIDVLKALAIYFVVLGHAPLCPHGLKQFIYSFHMPVFFAVYGMTYSSLRHKDSGFLTKNFLVKKVQRLLMPAFIWALGYSFINNAILGSFNLKSILYILYGSQASFRMAHSLSSIWFLPVMFLSVVLVEYIMKKLYLVSERNYLHNIVIVVVICILFIFSKMPPPVRNGYPWSINIVPMATACIFIGYLLKKVSYLWQRNCTWNILIAVLSILLTYILCRLNLKCISRHNVDMASGTYGNCILYALNVLVGTIMMMSTSHAISHYFHNKKILSFIGMNTLPIFLLHKPLIRGLCRVSNYYGWDSPFLSIMYSVVVVLFCALLAWGINIICPEIVGRNRNRRNG